MMRDLRERTRVAYFLRVVRTGESRVGVRLSRRWWSSLKGRGPGERTIVEFEFDTAGMGEHDIIRAALCDVLVYYEGGPDA